MKLLSKKNGFRLWQNEDFYWITATDDLHHIAGDKKEVISELERWKNDIDFKNDYMLQVEMEFLSVLK